MMWFAATIVIAFITWAVVSVWNENKGWHHCKKCGKWGRHPMVDSNFWYFTYRCLSCGDKFES